MRKIYTIIMLCCLLLNGLAIAGEGRYAFSSDLNEKRFQAFIHSTRCMLCQNQSVAESNSMFSEDMKTWLYEAIESGDTDYEIKQALIERFGDSVFYSPPFQMNTYLLWGLPGLFMLIGGLVIFRRRNS
jgi:cytochrome c-type biogenesis protein CcmH